MRLRYEPVGVIVASTSELHRTTHDRDNAPALTAAQEQDARRRERCRQCRRGDRLMEWHATVTQLPGVGQIVARRHSWLDAMQAAQGWTPEGQRAFVHQAVR